MNVNPASAVGCSSTGTPSGWLAEQTDPFGAAQDVDAFEGAAGRRRDRQRLSGPSGRRPRGRTALGEGRAAGARRGHDGSAARRAVAGVAHEGEAGIGLGGQFDRVAFRPAGGAVSAARPATDARRRQRAARRLGDRQQLTPGRRTTPPRYITRTMTITRSGTATANAVHRCCIQRAAADSSGGRAPLSSAAEPAPWSSRRPCSRRPASPGTDSASLAPPAAFAAPGVTMIVGADEKADVWSLCEEPTAVLPPNVPTPPLTAVAPAAAADRGPADQRPTRRPPSHRPRSRPPTSPGLPPCGEAWVAAAGLCCSRPARKARAPACDGSSASASTANRRAASRALLRDASSARWYAASALTARDLPPALCGGGGVGRGSSGGVVGAEPGAHALERLLERRGVLIALVGILLQRALDDLVDLGIDARHERRQRRRLSGEHATFDLDAYRRRQTLRCRRAARSRPRRPRRCRCGDRPRPPRAARATCSPACRSSC